MGKSSSKVDGRPAFSFYVDDWRGEDGLQVVSLAARGLWIEMLCRMWVAPVRGCLCYQDGSGVVRATDSKRLAKSVGASLEEVEGLLVELLDAGVCSVEVVDGEGIGTEGTESTKKRVIFCRRMRREAAGRGEISEKRREAGRAGAEKRWGGEDGKRVAKCDGKKIAKMASSSSIPDPVLSKERTGFAMGRGAVGVVDLAGLRAAHPGLSNGELAELAARGGSGSDGSYGTNGANGKAVLV